MSDAHKSMERLKASAKNASANAYSPYSGFKVGAALSAGDGRVYAGCNVESDSFGLTQCAERNALGSAVAGGTGKGEIAELVIYVPGKQALPPCGACRQVMYELLAPGALIVSCCDSDHYLSWQRETLMPDAFSMDDVPS